MFHGQPISKRLWPPRSPYLRQSDFLLRGFLKDSVYPKCPHALEKLQVNIQHIIDGMSNDTLQNGSITRFVVEDYVQNIMINILHCFIIY